MPIDSWRVSLVMKTIFFASLLGLTKHPLLPEIASGSVDWSIDAFAPSMLQGALYSAVLTLFLFLRLRIVILLAFSAFNTAQVLMLLKLPEARSDELGIVTFVGFACLALALASIRFKKGEVVFHRSRFDRSACFAIRTLTIICLSFIATHKTNADFLDPNYSCFTSFSKTLVGNFPFLGVLQEGVSPWLIPALDLTAALLLALVPRVGIAFTVILLFQFALTGPFSTTLRVMACTFAGLGARDLHVLRRYRSWKWVGSTALFTLGLMALFSTRSAFANLHVFLFMATVTCILSMASVLIFDSIKSQSTRGVDLLFSRRNLPVGLTSGVIVSLFVMLFTLNEMAPYLGIKKTFSHKMWSNLRVDHFRWNSLVFPESIKLSDRMDNQLLELMSVKVNSRSFSLFEEGSTLLMRDIYAARLNCQMLDQLALAFSNNGKRYQLTQWRQLANVANSLEAEWRKDQNSDRSLRIEIAQAALTEKSYFFSRKLVSAYALKKHFEKNSKYMIDYEVKLLHSGKEHTFGKASEGRFMQFLSVLTPAIDPLDFQARINRPQKCYH
jgi:hypothetical protein